MKKQLKTMLVAGFMAGLMMIQPVYGAEVTSAAVKQVIRMDAQGVGPVSYTHLTLPTIRLV